MKAIDLWVLICLLLTFTCLAEYGIILHMTSRSGWQKKMDEYVRTVSGKPKLRKVSAMEMGPLSLRKHDRRMSIDRCGGKSGQFYVRVNGKCPKNFLPIFSPKCSDTGPNLGYRCDSLLEEKVIAIFLFQNLSSPLE